jgi:hypothetical protein
MVKMSPMVRTTAPVGRRYTPVPAEREAPPPW